MFNSGISLFSPISDTRYLISVCFKPMDLLFFRIKQHYNNVIINLYKIRNGINNVHPWNKVIELYRPNNGLIASYELCLHGGVSSYSLLNAFLWIEHANHFKYTMWRGFHVNGATRKIWIGDLIKSRSSLLLYTSMTPLGYIWLTII